MKTKIALGALAMSIASFTVSADSRNPVTEQAGQRILSAFQHSAFMEYNALVPTLAQLYHVMDAHASFYGANLNDAKAALSRQYASDVSRIETSFLQAIEQSGLNHIAWSKAKFISAERQDGILVIAFTTEGNTHKMEIAVTEFEGELLAGKVIACR